MIGDALMQCPADQAVRELLSTPGRTAPVYKYLFEHQLEVLRIKDATGKGRPTGVAHGSDVPLVFRQRELLLGAGEDKLADQVVDWWQALATNGRLDNGTGTGMAAGVPWPRSGPAVASLSWDIAKGKPQYTVNPSAPNAVDCGFWSQVALPDALVFGNRSMCHAGSSAPALKRVPGPDFNQGLIEHTDG